MIHHIILFMRMMMPNMRMMMPKVKICKMDKVKICKIKKDNNQSSDKLSRYICMVKSKSDDLHVRILTSR